MICYCLEVECYCEPDDELIWRGRWRCTRCRDVMKVKFRRSHIVICKFRERVGLTPPRLGPDAATWTPTQEETP